MPQPILAMAGLPVPDQRIARTLEAAKAAAREIGYPVVVKPRALDGGKGVTANISDDARLEEAFLKVAGLSQTALVERYVSGDEYRLLFIDGDLISIHQRAPAQVTGRHWRYPKASARCWP